jgi:hypothetical protein
MTAVWRYFTYHLLFSQSAIISNCNICDMFFVNYINMKKSFRMFQATPLGYRHEYVVNNNLLAIIMTS